VVVLPYCSQCGRKIEALGKSRLGICPSCGLVDLSATPIQGKPSEAQHCQHCSKELPSDAKFCDGCGASLTAPIPTPPTVKVSHIKRTLTIVIMLVLLIGIFIVALYMPAQRTGTETTTTRSTQQVNRIRMGQPFILKEGSEKIPVEITFISAWFTPTHFHFEANAGYKLLVLEIQAKNVGMKETQVFLTDRWEATVDKGYVYEEKTCDLFLALIRPEENKTGYVLFEIPLTTSPLEVRYYSSVSGNDPTLILDTRSEVIPLKGPTPSAKEGLSMDSYEWAGSSLTLHIRNVGTVDVTVESYYIEEAGQIKAGPISAKTTIAVNSVEHVTINPPAGFNWASGHSYAIKLVTSRGTQFTFSAIAG